MSDKVTAFDPREARRIAHTIPDDLVRQQLRAAAALVTTLIDKYPTVEKPDDSAVLAWAKESIQNLRRGHAEALCRAYWHEGMIQAPGTPDRPSGRCSQPVDHDGDHIFPNNHRVPRSPRNQAKLPGLDE